MTKFLSLIVFILVAIIFWQNSENDRIAFIVEKQIPNIAHKAYLSGCFETQKSQDCHTKAKLYKEDLLKFMESIGTN